MRPSPAPPNVLLDELRGVHGMLRRDLKAARELAREVERGATAKVVQARLRSMQTRGPLWQLRVNCLSYCQSVRGHHEHEDEALFPAVRRSDPAMVRVVDRLVADHAKLAGLLDEVDAAARHLDGQAPGRKRLVDALTAVSTHLLAHLAYEEEALAPVLATWKRWPTARR